MTSTVTFHLQFTTKALRVHDYVFIALNHGPAFDIQSMSWRYRSFLSHYVATYLTIRTLVAAMMLPLVLCLCDALSGVCRRTRLQWSEFLNRSPERFNIRLPQISADEGKA